MSLRLNGSTSGYSELEAPAIAGDQTFTLPGTGGTLDRLNRAGNILQVVSATYATHATSTSTSYADTGLEASITPSSVSSKVLVITYQFGRVFDSAGSPAGAVQLLQTSTQLEVLNVGASQAGDGGTPVYYFNAAFSYLDSPSSTSAITYKTQFNAASGSTMNINGTGGVGRTSSIVLMEVAG